MNLQHFVLATITYVAISNYPAPMDTVPSIVLCFICMFIGTHLSRKEKPVDQNEQ
jgi:hypothetical protein